MNAMRLVAPRGILVSLLLMIVASFLARDACAEKLVLPDGAEAALEKTYSFDLEGAIEDAKRLQTEQPGHPLGFLLEAEARWWRIWCLAAEFKYGMTDARRRQKLPTDQRYLDLAASALTVAENHLKERDTAEMHFYAGLADAFSARLYGLRSENRATARAGVKAREHFLRAVQLDPQMADADFGLGLYNYYVDTLSPIVKILGFFMGIPGGNKQEGIRQLEHAIADGALTPDTARFYLALDLHRYDQQYERALTVIGPLADKYPSNPLFQLARGDLYGKLARKEKAVAAYRAAESLPVADGDCHARVQALARAGLSAQGVKGAAPNP
jgi:tetratricopeptide (TPR) repeat protein